MDMSPFTDIPFGNEASFSNFLMANDLAHQQVATALNVRGKIIPRYPLADMRGNPKAWLQLHQDTHQQELSLLLANTAGQNDVDLASVDLDDKDAYNDWIQGHADIHVYVNSLLGL